MNNSRLHAEKSASHEFILDRFEEEKAVIIDADNTEIILPAKLLPAAKEGDVIVMALIPKEEETKRREQTAKDILNEILKS